MKTFGVMLLSALSVSFAMGKSLPKDIQSVLTVLDKTEYSTVVELADALGDSSVEQTIFTLSFLAETLCYYAEKHPQAKPQMLAGISRIIELVLKGTITPFRVLEQPGLWNEYNLYLTHLNIILGKYLGMTDHCEYHLLNSRICDYLAEKIVTHPYMNIKSYPNHPELWPADNAATLYSLYLYDVNFGTNISAQPIRAWLDYMDQDGLDETTGLHLSELTGMHEYSQYARGCAMSMTVKYMADFAPKQAKELWKGYKKQFKKNYVLGCGFLEYPKGVRLSWDSDSGPILSNGLGAAATGLALMASKNIGDGYTYFQLRNAMGLMDLGVWLSRDEKTKAVMSSILARSIQLNARYR